MSFHPIGFMLERNPGLLSFFTVRPVGPAGTDCCKWNDIFRLNRRGQTGGGGGGGGYGPFYFAFLSPVPCICEKLLNWSKAANQLVKMERSISVGPVKVDHLQRWSQIFWSDQTKTDHSIWLPTEISENFWKVESTSGFSNIQGKQLFREIGGKMAVFNLEKRIQEKRLLVREISGCPAKNRYSTVLTTELYFDQQFLKVSKRTFYAQLCTAVKWAETLRTI